MTAALPADLTTTPERAALVDRFNELLVSLKRRLTAALPEEVRDEIAGATAHQLEAVGILSRSNEGVSMNDLAKQQGCALSTATALVDRLERQGLAERHDDPGDRRVVRIVATPRARRLVECAQAGKRDTTTRLLTPLDDDEVSTLVGLLNRITATEDS